MSGGVVVERTRNPRHTGIETPAGPLAHDLLNHHRHRFAGVLHPRRPAVSPGVGEMGGSPHELDGFLEPPEAGVLVELGIGNHLGGIHPRERVIQRVLEAARGPDRQGGMDESDERPQIAGEFRRYLPAQKGVGDAIVRRRVRDQIPEPVAHDEGVVDLGGDHGQRRNHNLETHERSSIEFRQETVVDEPQPRTLAAHGPAPDSGEGLVAGSRPAVETRDLSIQIHPRSAQAVATRSTAMTRAASRSVRSLEPARSEISM
jgi:hypothetical protein